MKSRLIFRILGALASALIIVSVFIPFISVTGYSTSLWQAFEKAKSLYLPIMIIVFGAIGLIFFAINFKTEFAYMSTGAILFFLVMQTFDVLKQDAFGSLSVGYYCLAVGSVLTGLMALLCNLKSKVKAPVVATTNAPVAEESILNKIDNLYSNQTLSQDALQQPFQTNISQINGSDGIISFDDGSSLAAPIQMTDGFSSADQMVNTPLNELGSVSQQPVPAMQEFAQPAPVSNPMDQEMSSVGQPLNSVMQEFAQPEQASNPMVQEMAPAAQSVNPTMQEFAQPEQVSNPIVQEMAPMAQPVNPTMQEFAQPEQVSNPMVQEMAPTAQPVNPTMQEFIQPEPLANPLDQANSSEPAPSNVTAQEFSKEIKSNYKFISVEEEKEPDNKPVNKDSNQSSVSLSNINDPGQMNQTQTSSGGLDIFGQPIN